LALPYHEAGEQGIGPGGERRAATWRQRSAMNCLQFSCVRQKSMLYFSRSRTGAWRTAAEEEKRGANRFETFAAELEGRPDFFIWIRRNPLKSPDSDE
jgi:hypothetical protein